MIMTITIKDVFAKKKHIITFMHSVLLVLLTGINGTTMCPVSLEAGINDDSLVPRLRYVRLVPFSLLAGNITNGPSRPLTRITT